MKLLSFALLFFALTFNQKQQQEIKLDGKYKMEYEADYVVQNCIIKISGDKYEKTLTNGSKRKGKIEVKKLKFGRLLILKDKGSELEVDIEGETYNPSDTIYFRTKKINEKDEDDMIVYGAKLIKIK